MVPTSADPREPADRPPRHVQRVGAYALVVDETAASPRLLMVRLTERTPFPGAWSLPGGRVEIGEHPRDAMLRELTEETGLTGTAGELLDVDSQVRDFYDLGDSDRVHHAIRILYRATVATTGPLVVHDIDGSSDSPTWVPVGEVAALPLLTPVARLAMRHLPVPAAEGGSTAQP